MPRLKKVTVMLPQELLDRAQGVSGEGVTGTIRLGLEAVAARRAFEGLRRLRGKLDLGIDLKRVRRDRE